MLTITGGRWHGRHLSIPKNLKLRPTAARVKEAIFSIIVSYRMKQGLPADLSACKCLDLYAGVGGLGLEALSRGAESCFFVEKQRKHFQIIEENIDKLQCKDQAKVFCAPVEKSKKIWLASAPYDLVFLDPPYDLKNVQKTLDIFSEENLLKENGLIVFEHDPKIEFQAPEGFDVHSDRILGPAAITVYTKKY